MLPLRTHLKANPPLVLLAIAVGAGLTGGAYMANHFLRNDPTVLIRNRKEDPFPWTRYQGNLKLYAVNQKFEAKEVPKY